MYSKMLFSGGYNWTGAIYTFQLFVPIAEMSEDLQSHDSSPGYQEYARLSQEHNKAGRSTQ